MDGGDTQLGQRDTDQEVLDKSFNGDTIIHEIITVRIYFYRHVWLIGM